MSKYRKPFLKQFTQSWADRFPAWQRGVCSPVFWARPDSTFSDSGSFSRCGLYFHLVIHFTSKWAGAFTGDIIITSSPEGFPPDCNPPHRWNNDVPDLLEGHYRIGMFIDGHDLWWHLVDEEAESRRVFESIPNIPKPVRFIKRRNKDWYASSYDAPLDAIATEATGHFCDSFEQHVIPKLNKAT